MSSLTKKCRICGDKASGFNFSGLSCESCKIYFRRNAFRSELLHCHKGGCCAINVFTRKNCQKCRLDRCFEIGMKKELIKINHSRRRKELFDSENCSERTRETVATDATEEVLTEKEGEKCRGSEDSAAHSSPVACLQAYELELLQEVRSAMAIFGDETCVQVTNSTNKFTIVEVFNITGLYITKIIRFCKSFQPFRGLPSADQLIILKAFYHEVKTVRFAFMYRLDVDGFPVMKNDSQNEAFFFRLNIFSQWKRKNVTCFLRRFVYSLQFEMENDATLRNLIIAHQLFKPRDNLTSTELIQYHHCVYRHLLKRYLEQKYRSIDKANKKYDTLNHILCDLHQITDLVREILCDLNCGQLNEIVKENKGIE